MKAITRHRRYYFRRLWPVLVLVGGLYGLLLIINLSPNEQAITLLAKNPDGQLGSSLLWLLFYLLAILLPLNFWGYSLVGIPLVERLRVQGKGSYFGGHLIDMSCYVAAFVAFNLVVLSSLGSDGLSIGKWVSLALAYFLSILGLEEVLLLIYLLRSSAMNFVVAIAIIILSFHVKGLNVLTVLHPNDSAEVLVQLPYLLAWIALLTVLIRYFYSRYEAV